MIIIGIGADLMEITRMESTIKRFAARFLNRVFTLGEQERSDLKPMPAASYAKRFAAKEAFVKALGVGISEGIRWSDVEVVNESTGQPKLLIHGRAAELLAMKQIPGHEIVVHLSLADTQDLAQAFVVIELVPHVQ